MTGAASFTSRVKHSANVMNRPITKSEPQPQRQRTTAESCTTLADPLSTELFTDNLLKANIRFCLAGPGVCPGRKTTIQMVR
jgi:3-methyladenine DNA glycosylase AlkC